MTDARTNKLGDRFVFFKDDPERPPEMRWCCVIVEITHLPTTGTMRSAGFGATDHEARQRAFAIYDKWLSEGALAPGGGR